MARRNLCYEETLVSVDMLGYLLKPAIEANELSNKRSTELACRLSQVA